jgi:organic radical activating enzyme
MHNLTRHQTPDTRHQLRKIVRAILPYGIVKLVQKRKMARIDSFFFEIHIVEHCNLNCNGCAHFSCLADEEYLDTKTFDADCQRISQITKNITVIDINGGEPLLHPELTSFFKIVRKYFLNKTQLKLSTNGILLASQTDEFWNACAENDVYIEISNYPIKIDNEKIEREAKKHNVKVDRNFNVKSTSNPHINLMYKVPIDLEGRQNVVYSYSHCPHPGCITLRDGKIYRCCTIAHIKFFNKYFSKNLQITEGDYIDIYKIKNADEIFAFLKGPFPFCRYCKPKEKVRDIKWAVTKKKITEWT